MTTIERRLPEDIIIRCQYAHDFYGYGPDQRCEFHRKVRIQNTASVTAHKSAFKVDCARLARKPIDWRCKRDSVHPWESIVPVRGPYKLPG
jgi:hypothetical protein